MNAVSNDQLPLATVVMVAYNSDRFIDESIESVLCQSHENLELIISDDCSTDNTWNVIQNYSDPRIRSFRNDENLGEYANRNQAIQLARGEYLIFIDADDILYPHGLEFMVRMLHAFPDSAMAMAKPWNEKIVYPLEITPHQLYSMEFLGWRAIAINFAHLLFRTEVLQKQDGFNLDYRAGDETIQLQIGMSHNSLLISDGLAWWRRTSGQASEKLLKNHFGWIEALQYRTGFLDHESCPLEKDEIRTAKSNLYGGFLRMVMRYFLKGRIFYASTLLSRAQIPLQAWQYLFTPARYYYLQETTAEAPLKGKPEINPLAKVQNR